MAEASLALKFQENMSAGLSALRNNMSPFRRDITDLQRELDVLNRTKIDMKVDMERAKRELAEAKKAFRDLGAEAADDTELRKAQENYDRLVASLKVVSDQARQTEKDMQATAEVGSKLDNRAGARSASGGEAGLMSRLGQAGLMSMAGDALSGLANAAMGSAFGDEMGSMFSSALSGVASGAAIGSLAGPVGTAVGAAIGGAVGLLNGGVANFGKRDDAFKSYYQGLYEQVESERTDMTKSGSGLAGQRETDQIAFSKLLGGESVASDYLADVRDLANHTPFLYSDLTSMSKSLAPAFGQDPERMISLIQAIGDAGASVGLDVSNMQMVGTAISRMESTGKTTLEYLNILQERGIDAYGFLADGLGKSKEQMLEMVSKGLIPGAEAAKMIQAGMEGAYQGAMELQSATYSGLTSTVEGLNQELDAAKGEQYNTRRKEDLEDEIDYLSGPMGDQLKEAYGQLGAWEAEVENEAGRIKREVMTSMMTGVMPEGYDEDTTRQLQEIADLYAEGGTKAGQALGRAEAMAVNLYYDSEGYQELARYQETLAKDIRNDSWVVGAWKDAGYNLGLEMTKGIAAAMKDTESLKAAAEETSRLLAEQAGPENTPYFDTSVDYKIPGPSDGSHAAGLRRVPYDGYRALLHEGERVQTAAEARAGAAGGGGVNVTISGNEFVVRSDADVDAIARAMVEEIVLRRKAGVL